jgi:EAL domain-containing protein (putative c-di-GMP-specific phosphodiesterase class I)
MIMMAKDLGMDTIAEGVETQEQLQELQSLMCQYAQGYLLSKPMQADAAEKYLQHAGENKPA